MTISQLIVVLVPLCLLGFWAWMFRDMLRSDDLPACFISLSGGADPRSDWTIMFVLLSLATALVYYSEVYRQRQ